MFDWVGMKFVQGLGAATTLSSLTLPSLLGTMNYYICFSDDYVSGRVAKKGAARG